MKRKLIEFDVFKKIEQDSLSSAETELVEAEDVLAHSLDLDGVSLHCFGESFVLYETLQGTYLYSNYQLDENSLTFEGIEELVLDEDEEKANAKEFLSSMVEELLEGNEVKAHDLFDDYIGLPAVRRELNEAAVGKKPFRLVAVTDSKTGKVTGYEKRKTRTGGPKKRQPSWAKKKRAAGKRKAGKKITTSERKRRKGLRASAKKKYGLMASEETMHQIKNISENVLDYIDYRELGPAIKDSIAKHDDKGNVIALRIPTSRARNEGKILSFNWKTLNHEVKVMRDASKNLSESVEFCKAVADLNRQNAFSDSEALQESLETIISKWPNVMYLTQTELAKVVGEALDVAGVTKYDDQVCDFMAEGILRTAHGTYTDRVAKVLKLANSSDCKQYECFQEAAGQYYPYLDEATAVEMQVFYDLYTVVGEVYHQARRSGDEGLEEEAQYFMRDLHAIVEGEIEPDIDLAEEVAEWVYTLVETNLETAPWNPANAVHISVTGDHPRMAQLAAKPYSPKGDFSGDWGDSLPVSDGKNYKGGLAKQMRNRSWGNVGGPDTYPSLQNPYTPKPFGDYTLKGEPGVDKNSDSGFAQDGGSDTWPNLQNPYCPKAETPQSYKMNNGKEDDLVVDL
jgi:hypothetical protein